jgi:hypothetical protein
MVGSDSQRFAELTVQLSWFIATSQLHTNQPAASDGGSAMSSKVQQALADSVCAAFSGKHCSSTTSVL